jgi:hypothetical protein
MLDYEFLKLRFAIGNPRLLCFTVVKKQDNALALAFLAFDYNS